MPVNPHSKIRVGVAGLGRIGWHFHCKTLAGHPDFDLVAVQDADEGRLREAKETYGVATFGRLADMLRSAGLEVVAIATPTHLHREMAGEALRSGCHVMLEKPMAASARETEAIVRSAARHGRVLTVYQPHRAAAYFQHLRRILASGKIGQVYHVRRGMFNYVRRNDWQSLRRYGGGMLNNYGAHALDQVLQLVGCDVARVFCSLRRVASLGDADDVAKVLFETRRGSLGEVDINQASAVSPYELQVWGSRGSITLANGVFGIRYFEEGDLPPKPLDRSLASANRAYPSDDIPWREETVVVDAGLEVDVYADLAAAIRGGRPPLVQAKEALAVMRLIERCREDSGRVVRMSPL